jgi:hypothetical protein
MVIDNSAILADLDPDQIAVVSAIRGPVCVIAGAGTGKTRVITNRIAYAINAGVTDPTKVLELTFTGDLELYKSPTLILVASNVFCTVIFPLANKLFLIVTCPTFEPITTLATNPKFMLEIAELNIPAFDPETEIAPFEIVTQPLFEIR